MATPSALDATLAQLQVIAVVYGMLARWDIVLKHRDMTLGNALKLIPQDEAEWVMDLLRRGGMLP